MAELNIIECVASWPVTKDFEIANNPYFLTFVMLCK